MFADVNKTNRCPQRIKGFFFNLLQNKMYFSAHILINYVKYIFCFSHYKHEKKNPW